MVYQSVLALGYEPVLYVYYNEIGVMINEVADLSIWMDIFCSVKGPGLRMLCKWKVGFLCVLEMRCLRTRMSRKV